VSGRTWFRPKSFGYGATPTTWQGWALTLASALVSAAAAVMAVIAEAGRWPDRRPLQAACIVVFAATIIATIAVSRCKTDGDWRWRG
jgi:hypothetical protein